MKHQHFFSESAWRREREAAAIMREERQKRRAVVSAGRTLGGYDPGHVRAAIARAERILGVTC